MSAVVSPAAGEGGAGAPTFSYAQAAKGRSPSLSAAAHGSKSNQNNGEPTPRSASAHQVVVASGIESSPAARRASEGQLVTEKVDEATFSNDTSEVQAAEETRNTASHSTSESQPQFAPSPPPSPGFGSTSTSTLPKEDDVSPTPNGSSESTWDKISQTSQNAEKANGKADGDDEDSKLSSWEHVPISATLKEAPPPAFNIWTKRAMDHKAKATKEPKLSQSTGGLSNTDLLQQGVKKPLESGSDLGKLDSKKRNKSGQVPDDKSTSPTARDAGKTGDWRHRNSEDDRRSYSGGRAGDTSKPAVSSSTPPPPPGDAISWPTPDIAQEDKKKSQDRSEKADKEKTPAKAHGKEKWVPVPYVPTAVFNTPLPPGRRGGGRAPRGGREGGARGGHAMHGSIGGSNAGEKQSAPSTGNPTTPATAGNDRSKGDMGPPRPGPLAPRPKRAASAGPPTSREQQRKFTDPATNERHGEQQMGETKQSQEIRSGPDENRRASTATQTDGFQNGRQVTPPGVRNENQGYRRQSQNTIDRDNGQSSSQDHAHPRSTPDRRSEGSMRPQESFREHNGFSTSRNGEGRPERGRGGFRGRGGYNGFGGNHSTNGQNPPSGQSNHQASTGYTPTKSQSLTERTAPPAQVTPFTPQSRDRGHRANSRSQSIPNQTGYGRFPNGGPPPLVAQHLPALQTDLANMYGYQPPTIMSAMPYQPYVEQMQLLGMVQMQMEYYFSLENLCKDMFLRKHMDSQGFVFLSLLMNFNRIRQLTSDIDLIRSVCRMSQTIDIQIGMDGLDRVRKAEGWQQWVLSMEERDPTVRNEAPVVMQQPVMWDPFRSHGNATVLSPRSSGVAGQNRMGPPAQQPLNGINPLSPPSVPDVMHNGYVSNGQISHTPLSAAVPDFTPGLQPANGTAMSTLEPPPKNSFSDEQVESLMIVIRKPHTSTTSSRPPFPSAASRTFSNGSIDGSTLCDEIPSPKDKNQGTSFNGEHTPENHDKESSQRSRSPFNRNLASKQPNAAVSPVFWVKDQEAPIDDLPNDLTHESYTMFRQNALKQREQSLKSQCHRDMDILYQFWSHFLIRNFNNRMYDEFRQLAFEDYMSRDTSVGLQNLVMYYDESILGQKIIPDGLARDYVDLVKAEASGKERIAFDKLRAAWRNGALNLKNRVKIDKILDADLKAELER